MIKKISIATAVLLMTSALSAGVWTQTGKIDNTPHDLGGTTTGDNGEICVYCHTPHASNTSFTGAPLWNKEGPAANTVYRLYGATANDANGITIAGTQVGGQDGTAGDLSSPSLACLSCHDGVSAIDSIVNAPGSGTGNLNTGSATMVDYIAVANQGFGGDIGDGLLGDIDMSNDHPVSVKYTAGKASLKATTTTLTNWVGAATIGDLLRGSARDQVECSSCHDPHNGYATVLEQGTAGSPQVNYLRQSNANSALCLGCHDK